ncbi:hypothetical protein ACF0H5_014247 [Mactra antiquata]
MWRYLLTLSLVCLTPVIDVEGQINMVPGAGQTQFFLDKYSDCDGRPREVGQSTVFISGVSTDHQGQPVTSCSITLNTENVREPYRFKLQFLSVRIDQPGISFYVYDGEFNGRQLWAFNQQQQKPSNLEFDFTTGQLVTFRLTRGELDREYDIRIVATPVPSQTVKCTYENEYGCDEYGYNYRLLGTKEIAGIIAGCFGLVFIVVIIIVICCYRKQKGVTRKWQEQTLGQVNTAASLHSLNGRVPHSSGPNSTRPWTSESSKNGFASIRRSPNLPRAKIARSQRYNGSDTSSNMGSNASLPMKRPLPPPHVNLHPDGSSVHTGRRRRDRYEKYEYDDESSDGRSLSTATKNFSERNYKPPAYRDAIRNDSESSADETTFVGANDSRQQSVFVERILTPRKTTKLSPQVLRAQKALPPPDQDEEYDSIEPKKKTVNSNNKSSDKKQVVDTAAGSDDDTEESDTENESEEEEEDSEEESDVESDDEDDKPDVVYSKPNKDKTKTENVPAPPPPPPTQGFRPPPNSQPQQFQGPPQPGYVPPGVHQPQPRYGHPGQQPAYPQGNPQFQQGQPPYLQGQPQYPQGQPQYPQGQPQYPQGQLQYPQAQPQYPQGQKQYPMGQYPSQHQPPKRNTYDQANFSVPLDGQQQPVQSQRPREHYPSHKSNNGKGTMPAGNPPVYSYLVNRGYQPLDGRYSPVSTSTGASNLSGDRNLVHEDSDFSANLGSGVELMKRKN